MVQWQFLRFMYSNYYLFIYWLKIQTIKTNFVKSMSLTHTNLNCLLIKLWMTSEIQNILYF